MTKVQLEKRYGIHIADDSHVNPLNGRFVKQYKIYSADGCLWEKGLKTVKAIEKECREWSKDLIAIKEYADANPIAKCFCWLS